MQLYNESISYDAPILYNGSDVVVVDTNAGGGLKRKYPRYQWRDHRKEEEDELKLSQLLAQQLQEQIRKNAELAKAVLEQSKNLQPTVEKVAAINPANPTQPPKSPMNPAKKAELLKRLELARQTKEANKQAEEERARQRLKNLAKARRVKAKNQK